MKTNVILLGKRGIAVDTTQRLAKALGSSEGFWLRLQADYDIEVSRREIGADLEQIERLVA
jgi:antitoxin HigA-1